MANLGTTQQGRNVIKCPYSNICKVNTKKIIALCPQCKSPIQGQYVFNSKGFSKKFESVKSYPFPHVVNCPHNQKEKITLYFDANLAVRDLMCD